jgi:glycosyltransferase involved in cell wall biosynthesis
MLGSDVWSLGRIPILRRFLARVIRRAQRAYADGYKLAEAAERIAGVPIEFLPSTRRIGLVDPESPRGAPPYRLLFLGRWHANKGVDLLLDALAMLNDEEWLCIERDDIQGGGALEDLGRARARALQCAGRPVNVGGFLAKTEAEAAIASADWVLIPSRIESIPVIFSDALKLGRPVVVMPVGDLPRLLESGGGVVSRDVSANGFRMAIKAALQVPGGAASAGAECNVSEFSIGSIAHRIAAKTPEERSND